jgi:nitrilase/aliphatic nitrilase
MEDIVADASRQGANLVVFPEAFVPGFPLWAFVHPPIDIHPFARRLYDNALDVPGRRIEWLGALARRHCLYLSVGVTERSPISTGTLYNTNLLFNPDGLLLNQRRKLMPTLAEKLVWGQGDASDLRPAMPWSPKESRCTPPPTRPSGRSAGRGLQITPAGWRCARWRTPTRPRSSI